MVSLNRLHAGIHWSDAVRSLARWISFGVRAR